MLSGHDEELSDHSGSLTNVFLDKFRTTDSDESTVGVMSNGSGEKGFAGTWRSIHEDTFGLGDTERFKDFWMFDG